MKWTLAILFTGASVFASPTYDMDRELKLFREKAMAVGRDGICDSFLETQQIIREILNDHWVDALAPPEIASLALERLDRASSADREAERIENRVERGNNQITLQKMIPRSQLYTHGDSMLEYLKRELMVLEKASIVEQVMDHMEYPWGPSQVQPERRPGDEGRAYRLLQVLQINMGIISKGPHMDDYIEMANEFMTPEVMLNLISERMLDRTREFLHELKQRHPDIHAILLNKFRAVVTEEIL